MFSNQLSTTLFQVVILDSNIVSGNPSKNLTACYNVEIEIICIMFLVMGSMYIVYIYVILGIYKICKFLFAHKYLYLN